MQLFSVWSQSIQESLEPGGHPATAPLFTGDGDSISAFQGLFLIGSNVVPSDVDNPSLYAVTWI